MGNAATHHEARKRLRRKLEAAGVPADEIARQVDTLRSKQRQARADDKREALPKSERARRRAESKAARREIDAKFKQAQQRSIEDYQRRQEAERAATWDRLTPDDSKYRPAPVDPLLTGPARVTADTAKAARRKKATTKYEYDKGNADA